MYKYKIALLKRILKKIKISIKEETNNKKFCILKH